MFSLIRSPWIRAVDVDGNPVEVGLHDVFSGEVNIAYLQGESPAQNYAVMRILLATFWRSHAQEAVVGAGKTFQFADWFEKTRDRLNEEGRDPTVVTYLEKYQDRFDLFDDKAPFMQVAGLHVTSGETKHVTTIVPESQESYFSMKAGVSRDTLTFSEAARWLVYAQAYDYSGIKSGMVGDSRVKGGKGYPIGTGWAGMTGGTLIKGQTLLDTLILNTTVDCLNNPADRPVWERNIDGPDSRESVGENPLPQGPADLATWQSRRIRLVAEGDAVTAVVLGNGDRIPEAGANTMDDPMTPYRFSSNKSKKNLDIYYPRPYDAERTMWRSLDSLIVAETDAGFSGKDKAPKRPKNLSSIAVLRSEVDGIPEVLDLELVSVEYGPQASSVASTFQSSISMPVVLLLESAEHLRSTVRAAASATSESAIALGRFAGQLLDAAGGTYEFQTPVTNRVLAELEPLFSAWLRSLKGITEDDDGKIDELVAQWQVHAREIIDEHARILLRGAGPKALAGRVEKKEGETKARVVSAARYYQSLQSKLDEQFPLTVKKKEVAK